MATIFKCASMQSRGGNFMIEGAQELVRDTEERGYTITDEMIVQHHGSTAPQLCILARK